SRFRGSHGPSLTGLVPLGREFSRTSSTIPENGRFFPETEQREICEGPGSPEKLLATAGQFHQFNTNPRASGPLLARTGFDSNEGQAHMQLLRRTLLMGLFCAAVAGMTATAQASVEGKTYDVTVRTSFFTTFSDVYTFESGGNFISDAGGTGTWEE